MLKLSVATHKYIILITDGLDNRTSYSRKALAKEAERMGIIIHAIGISIPEGKEDDFTKVTTITGGTYYLVNDDEIIKDEEYDGNDIVSDVFGDIENNTINIVTDSDGDGLSDHHEKCGLPTGFGTFVNTDPMNPDTDGDGLKDGEELVIREGLHFSYAEAKTDPMQWDTDCDGYSDYEEIVIYHSFQRHSINSSQFGSVTDRHAADNVAEKKRSYVYGYLSAEKLSEYKNNMENEKPKGAVDDVIKENKHVIS